MKVYRGAAAGARTYLEADRSRADDYYLAEGTGLAQRFSVDGDGRVLDQVLLSGDGYEAWVAGVDSDTGEPKGRLRADAAGVRFVEVVINGPKAWSIAAETSPEIAAAYEAAQNRAVGAVLSWLGQHTTTRVGPRGAQVAIPVAGLEAVAVRHYTSRAGDPHRHVHLQINARVLAAGKWRGIDTVAVRDSIAAIQGIAHNAVLGDPQFRTVLAAHGFSITDAGEVEQLTPYVHAFSRRATQIAAHVTRYETEWHQAHPGAEAGPALHRAWDARAWAEARPSKNMAVAASVAHERWVGELAALGYQPPAGPAALTSTPVAILDRDAAAAEVLARVGARRSAWNLADLRGETELVLARSGILVEVAVRTELAEDITARAYDVCLPILDRAGVPEHVRAWTSAYVLDVEDDLTGRLAARGVQSGHDAAPDRIGQVVTDAGLDGRPARAVQVLAGDHALVVVEGAAGAGKTTTLAAVKGLVEADGRRLLVVTPTLKAAQVAAEQLATATGSAAWLAHQHGWRWGDSGIWIRVTPGQPDPVTGRPYTGPAAAARLDPGDLLVIDEAGMLDQDTARALLTIADEHHARVALIGDRYQLSAVGRGGVLSIAERWTHQHVTLDVIHRFTTTHTDDHGAAVLIPDTEYAALTLQMRSGDDPGAVFDRLTDRGRVVVHASVEQLQSAVAEQAVHDRRAGVLAALVVDTREQASELNAAIRELRVAAGEVDDTDTVTTDAGQRIGVGDVVATRRNDHNLGVANRDTWTISGISAQGGLQLTHPTGQRGVPADYVAQFVELAYAMTAYGVQGDTTDTSIVVLTDNTSAGSAYVGMTRGRHANTVHLVAETPEQARQQWIDVFARDRADTGLTGARAAAAQAASQYATPRPVQELVEELRGAWTVIADTQHWLPTARQRVASLQQTRDLDRAADDLRKQESQQRQTHARLENRVATARASVDETASAIGAELQAAWERDRPTAREQARIITAGPGKLHLRSRQISDARQWLTGWAAAWAPVVGDLTRHPYGGLLGFARRHPLNDHMNPRLAVYARTQAEQQHPDLAALSDTAADALGTATATSTARAHLSETRARTGIGYGLDYTTVIPTLQHRITDRDSALATAHQRAETLEDDPAVRATPGGVAAIRADWQQDRTDTEHANALQTRANQLAAEQERRARSLATSRTWQPHPHGPSHGPGISR